MVRHNGESRYVENPFVWARDGTVPEIMTSVPFHKLKINTVGILIIPQSDDRE